MTTLLIWLTLIVAVAIVAVVAYHLIAIAVALKRTADALAQLAAGLVAIRDHTVPLGGRIETINAGLSTLLARLLAVNGNLAAIVAVATKR
jgi:hypothetical protein